MIINMIIKYLCLSHRSEVDIEISHVTNRFYFGRIAFLSFPPHLLTSQRKERPVSGMGLGMCMLQEGTMG